MGWCWWATRSICGNVDKRCTVQWLAVWLLRTCARSMVVDGVESGRLSPAAIHKKGCRQICRMHDSFSVYICDWKWESDQTTMNANLLHFIYRFFRKLCFLTVGGCDRNMQQFIDFTIYGAGWISDIRQRHLSQSLVFILRNKALVSHYEIDRHTCHTYCIHSILMRNKLILWHSGGAVFRNRHWCRTSRTHHLFRRKTTVEGFGWLYKSSTWLTPRKKSSHFNWLDVEQHK